MLVSNWGHVGVRAGERREQALDAEDLLREYVAELAADERVFGASSALHRYGRVFEATRQHPEWLIRGRAKQCYKNAAAYASVREDIFYAEGYAIDPALPIPIEHAWLVDLTGQVVDPTWNGDGAHVYFGVAFKHVSLKQIMAANSGEPGILINWHRFLGRSSRTVPRSCSLRDISVET